MPQVPVSVHKGRKSVANLSFLQIGTYRKLSLFPGRGTAEFLGG